MFNGRWVSIFESRHEPGSGTPLAGAFRSKRGARRKAETVSRFMRLRMSPDPVPEESAGLMARKLKTYQTSLGFFDLAIAAPSMKAALQAWGSKTNLFHQGFAKNK